MEEARGFIGLIFWLLITGACSSSFQFLNNCTYPVWVGTLSGAGSPSLAQTGFELQPGQSTSLAAPPAWSGRFWARTNCSTNPVTGKYSCTTADCSTGKVSCDGSGATPPATLIEITLGTNGGKDFYDISLVDGFNVPASMAPMGGKGDCKVTSCPTDVNEVCPEELRVAEGDGTGVVACKSACEAFGDPRYCCTGTYGGPNTCKPTNYSKVFKGACPLAYSYAYDDATSTFTCAGASYVVTFCP
ncbi:thaumatin-like protein 1b isoform X1 [Elaeis guineensis]|uniref:Thaumatin-like protein 1b n=1 Tax=Elaeis guineensis var. tenera TaxID=51953 RepID=A0A6J0PHQ0_ELAGV|nr:thaumatin-like protein 1b [Elaeis guineensis]